MTTSVQDAPPARVAPRVTRREWWALGAVTAAFTALVALWSIVTPIYDAPDEPQHFNSAVRLAMGGGWPDPGDAQISSMILGARGQASMPAADRSTFSELAEAYPGYDGVDQMTQHPPLYYAYGAGVLTAIGFMDVRADLALLAVRLAGLLFALPLPFLAWDSIRRLTRSPKAALVGAAAVIAVPQLAHIMGAVSNDGMAVLFSSVVVWLAVRIMTGDRRWITVVGIGLALALALLTKGTTLPLVPFVGVVMLVWPRAVPFWHRFGRTAVAMAVGFTGGWWWARNLLVYGGLQPDGLVYPSKPWEPGTGPSIQIFFDTMWGRLPSSFWGNFGWLRYPLPAAITDTLTVIALAVIVGFAFRRSLVRGQAFALASLPLVFFAALTATTWSGYVRTQLPAGMQGRYMFVVIIALIALSAIGWLNFVRPERRRAVGTGLLVVFAVMALLGLYIEARAPYSGVRDLLLRVPVGTIGLGLAVVVTAALCAAAFVLALRFVRARPVAAGVTGAPTASAEVEAASSADASDSETAAKVAAREADASANSDDHRVG